MTSGSRIPHAGIEQRDRSTVASDLTAFVGGVSDLFARVRRWLEDNSEQITALVRTAHRNVIFDKAGWLLHHTTPLHLITDDMTERDITPILEAYYRDNWLSVAVAFRSQLAMMDIDEEARAVFDEALAAHSAGLYRAAVRALFPEIERVAREHLLEGTLKGIASLTEVRRATGYLGWSELQKFGEGPIFGQFAAMSHHLYEVVKTPERIAELTASPIPNRHAALHGLVAYSSLQSSLAALIMTEFMFKAISILKAQPEIVPAPKVQLPGTDASPLS